MFGNGFPGAWNKTAVTIAASGSVSGAATIGEHVSDVKLEVPALTSATLTVQACMDATNYRDIWDQKGNMANPAVIVTGNTTGNFFIDIAGPGIRPAAKYYKVALSATQAASRSLTFWYR